MVYLLRFLSLLLLILHLGSCTTSPSVTREIISLPADGPVLIVGEPQANTLEKIKAALNKTTFTAPYDRLAEDSLFQYRNLVLLAPAIDSLTAHHRTAVERFVLAGGRLLIFDARAPVPYWWSWYDRMRTAQPAKAFAHGDGRILAVATKTPETESFFAAAPDPAPASAPVLPPPAPQTDRFQLEILDDDIYEPMEMEVLPNGSVLFLERRGKMKLYRKGGTKVVHDFAVCTEGNYEDGLHGIALDPAYGKDNHHIYLYYSPAPCDSTDQLLSRFEFKDGILDTTSEVVVLRVNVQRETCCHSGGSVEFGADGLLYLSTGDNTSSKESDGYSPLDERPGRAPFDAQKSSGNTNDLRGKILRIRPTPDGGYEIPEGNLFPDGKRGRPEIYVMGARNPFRIAIDPWTNYLYWGDVGPDVGEAGRYGPQSYDEWNQAPTAGNYGWPYFVGDNYAYPTRDFATDEVGAPYEATRPINDSPNNTGARELPPARPALIWYPYGLSEEFPVLGTGSRSAMAGPFYDPGKLVPITNSALPEYYHGKWFIYEWARSWIKVVTLDSARREVVQIEDFLPDLPISKPIDFKVGNDGSLYLLEYGNDYFLNNPDARLVRISYSARNRPPVAVLTTDETAGGVPFQPTLSAAGSSDPDDADSLTYRWFINGADAGARQAVFRPTLTQPGVHLVRVEVRDSGGSTSEATLSLAAGNTRPDLNLEVAGNRSFLLPGRSALTYSATVDDPEDRSAGRLRPDRILVNATWVTDPELSQGLRQGTTQLPSGDLAFAAGASLMAESDCYTCHKERGENVGPAYLAVAERYDDSPATIQRLAGKVIKGGNGAWGERLMSAHPTLSPEDAATMVGYILSLNNGGLPARGEVVPGAGEGSYVLAASYRDGGGRNAPPLVGQETVVLRPTWLEAEDHHDGLYRAGVPGSGQQGAFSRVNFRPGGWLRLANVHLRGVRALQPHLHANQVGELELRYGAPDGDLLAAATVQPTEAWNATEAVPLRLSAVVDRLPAADLYLVWKGEGGVITDDMGHHRPGDVGWVNGLEIVGRATAK